MLVKMNNMSNRKHRSSLNGFEEPEMNWSRSAKRPEDTFDHIFGPPDVHHYHSRPTGNQQNSANMSAVMGTVEAGIASDQTSNDIEDQEEADLEEATRLEEEEEAKSHIGENGEEIAEDETTQTDHGELVEDDTTQTDHGELVEDESTETEHGELVEDESTQTKGGEVVDEDEGKEKAEEDEEVPFEPFERYQKQERYGDQHIPPDHQQAAGQRPPQHKNLISTGFW